MSKRFSLAKIEADENFNRWNTGDRRDVHQKINNFLKKIELHHFNSLKVQNLSAKISLECYNIGDWVRDQLDPAPRWSI
jgi:hypothetical protein